MALRCCGPPNNASSACWEAVPSAGRGAPGAGRGCWVACGTGTRYVRWRSGRSPGPSSGRGTNALFAYESVASGGSDLLAYGEFYGGPNRASMTDLGISFSDANILIEGDIASADVPLPAGLPLLLAGLGALGVMRRRNR